jgi:hypothetical protein
MLHHLTELAQILSIAKTTLEVVKIILDIIEKLKVTNQPSGNTPA